MSNHKTPLTDIERRGLEANGLGRYIGEPSQLADVFRQGVAWALAQPQPVQHPEPFQVLCDHCDGSGNDPKNNNYGCAVCGGGGSVFRMLYTSPQAQHSQISTAWAEGYKAGVDDERTSEANIGIAGFNAKVNPNRQNPYRHPSQRSAKT